MESAAYKHKVQYYETDQMRIVHHSNYIRWFEEARTDFLEKSGFSYAWMEEHGIVIPVLGVSAEYRQMVHYGDEVFVLPTVVQFNGLKLGLLSGIRDVGSTAAKRSGCSPAAAFLLCRADKFQKTPHRSREVVIFQKGKADLPFFDRCGKRQKGKLSGGQISFDKFPDNAGDAEPGARELNQQIHAADLQNLSDPDLMAGKIIVDINPCDIFFVQQHKIAGGKNFLPLGRAAFPQAEVFEVGSGRDKDILDLSDGLKGESLQAFRPPDQADINFFIPEQLNGLQGGLAENGEADMRVERDEVPEAGQQKIFAERDARADADMADAESARLPDGGLSFAERAEGILRVAVEQPAGLGQSNAAGAARKQTGLQGGLEPPDCLGDGWLADKQLSCGGGDIAGFGNLIEDLIAG